MLIVRDHILVETLKKMAEEMYGGLVKAVVDIEQNIMAVDAELHADEEALLLDHGSKQEHLWGINIYPDNIGKEDWIEFDSMINVRPSQGNRSRLVGDKNLQLKIITIVKSLIK